MAREEAAAAQAASATAQTVDGFGTPVTPMPTAGDNADAANSLAPSRPAAALAVNETSQARPLERTARASEPGERAPTRGYSLKRGTSTDSSKTPKPHVHCGDQSETGKEPSSLVRAGDGALRPWQPPMRAGIRGRDQSHPRSRFSV